MIYTVHSRAWWREYALHRLAMRRLVRGSARRRTPGRWVVAA
ncbi:MAG TPA: hypothetical protein VIQ30_24740 [Pseudonocardia sp.]